MGYLSCLAWMFTRKVPDFGRLRSSNSGDLVFLTFKTLNVLELDYWEFIFKNIYLKNQFRDRINFDPI